MIAHVRAPSHESTVPCAAWLGGTRMTSEAIPPSIPPSTPPPTYALRFSVDYPDRLLDRFTSFFRILFVIPIAIVLTAVTGTTWSDNSNNSEQWSFIVGSGLGVGFLAPLLMIVFRQKYPRWWFDFSVQLMRFGARVCTYLALMTDKYPATDEEQHVHLDADYPDVQRDLNRWLPLIKWLLALPHYIVLSSAARKRTTGAEQKWATGSAIGAEGWPVSAMRLGFGRRAAGR